jgi:hypothetical protein
MELEAITYRVWQFVKNFFYKQRLQDVPIVRNLNIQDKENQKRAVICYLTAYFFRDWNEVTMGRTQPYEIMAIVRVLAKLGYRIDIVNCNDSKAIRDLLSTDYDLIFGFGEAFYGLCKQNPAATTVLYMTEHHPVVAAHEEEKRIAYYKQRHGREVSTTRSNRFYSSKHLDRQYTHLILLGEKAPFMGQYADPFQLFPTGLTNPSFSFKPKEHTTSRKEFLWLGSPGAALHKGLDLLVDVFSTRDDVVLHIAGVSEADRKSIPIPAKSNIKDYGFINIKSDEFLEIVSRCSYLILPSCAEGFATSVTTGMLHGLIPVVMRNTGFNRIAELAVLLDDFELPYIYDKITELSQASPGVLQEREILIHAFAQENFSVAAFERRFYDIFKTIDSSYDTGRTLTNAPALVG